MKGEQVIMMIAGAYDYIEECRETYGDDHIDNLIESGHEPVYVHGVGWRWIAKVEDRARTHK